MKTVWNPAIVDSAITNVSHNHCLIILHTLTLVATTDAAAVLIAERSSASII